MPGFVLQFNEKGQTSELNLDNLKFNQHYAGHTLFQSGGLQIAMNAYEGYPFKTFETDSFFCLVEGCFYLSETESTVTSIFEFLEQGKPEAVNEIVKELDGEFVLVFYSKNQGKLFLVNDHLGRLPVYWQVSDGQFIASREIAFFKNHLSQFTPSKVDVSMYLMFGYTLGNATIYKAIKKLLPNGVFEFNMETQSHYSTSGFNINTLLNPTEKVDVKDLLARFSDAVKRRSGHFNKPNLSLSGGLDSRLIAAVIARSGLSNFGFSTFQKSDRYTELDLTSSKEILASLGLESAHRLVKLQNGDDSDKNLLLSMKCGLNSSDMAFLLPFLRDMSEVSDCMFTGDGGDKFFADLRPNKNIRGLKALVKYIIETQAVVGVETTAKWLEIAPSAIYERLVRTIESYEVSDWNEAYAAFLIRERGMNWSFEGEDRNRYFVWSTSPYFGPKVMEAAMSFSMKSKVNGGLFAELFKLLPGDLNRVLNPNWMLSLNQTKEIERLYFRQKIKAKLPGFIKGILGKHFSNRPTTFRLVEGFESNNVLDLQINKDEKVPDVVADRLEGLVHVMCSSS